MIFHCAHVGHTESQNDYDETVDAETWLENYLNVTDGNNVDLYTIAEYFDLNEGRDFLDNTKPFKVVVLHRIYQRPNDAKSGPLLLSAKHDANAWKTALANTDPKFVIAYGGTNEVSGGYLNDIPNYKMVVYDTRKAVYERITT